MATEISVLDSDSVGDPTRFLTFDALVSALRAPPPAPTDIGRVAAVVVRSDGGHRETPARVPLTRDGGVTGDAWARHDGRAESQITVMQDDVATLIANGQPLALFGDNLFFALDLSSKNLPIGTKLRAGSAVLEVTPKPHNGCVKFQGRFGKDALRFVSVPELRHRNMRGIYVRVIEDGEIGPGDPVEVIARPDRG